MASNLVLMAVWGVAAASDSAHVIRVNQVGYPSAAPKVAVLCSLDSMRVDSFVVRDSRERVVLGPKAALATGSFGPCARTFRLDFSALRAPGSYTIVAGAVRSPLVRIDRDVFAGAVDTLLGYMRQQRSGFNPFFRDSVHKLDAYVIADTEHGIAYRPVSGGWADAADYLQYVATSATATYQLLMAYRDHPRAATDAFAANGL